MPSEVGSKMYYSTWVFQSRVGKIYLHVYILQETVGQFASYNLDLLAPFSAEDCIVLRMVFQRDQLQSCYTIYSE